MPQMWKPTSRAITGTATMSAASTTVRAPKSDLMPGRLRLRCGRFRAFPLGDDRRDAELPQDGIGDRRRGAGERIAAARHLRKRDHLPDVRLAGHEGDDAIDPRREPTV